MHNPRASKRQFTAPHIICSAHKLNTTFGEIFSLLLSLCLLKLHCSQLIVEFNIFFVIINMKKNGLHSNFLSSNKRNYIIFFNSHLVTDPDFRAHYLNICTLLLRL